MLSDVIWGPIVLSISYNNNNKCFSVYAAEYSHLLFGSKIGFTASAEYWIHFRARFARFGNIHAYVSSL